MTEIQKENKSVRKVPNLRFPGFDGEWEAKKLVEIGEIITGSTPPTNEESYYVGEYLFVSPADIQANRHVESTRTTLTEKGFKKGRKIRKGSSLFVCIGSTIGKIGQAKEDCITNQQINSVVSFNMEDDFVFSLLEFHSARIKLLSAEQAVPIINKTTFSNVEVNTPCIKEQQKIGSFLSLLDSRIQTQNKILKELIVLKTSFTKRIFSQELRFKGKNNFPHWKIKKLGEIATISTGSSNRVDSVLNGKYTFFDRSQDIRTSNRYLFDKESVIIPGEGQEFIPKYFIGKFDLHQRTYAIYDFIRADGKYLYYHLLNDDKHLQSQAVGSTVKSLRLPMFQSMPIKFPCMEEQTKISSFLSSLDSKIDVESKLLLKLEEQKKFLLQQLFV